MKNDNDKFIGKPKKCILDESKICDNCCECFVCVLDSDKICDGCGECLDISKSDEFPIERILLHLGKKKDDL